MSVMCATIISKLEKGKRTKLNDNDSDSEVLGKGAVKLNFGSVYSWDAKAFWGWMAMTSSCSPSQSPLPRRSSGKLRARS